MINWLYIGSTKDLRARIVEHQSGKTQSTKSFLPLYLAGYIAVRTSKQARKLEKYLKTGSGKVILKKRIQNSEYRISSLRSQRHCFGGAGNGQNLFFSSNT